MLHVLLLRLTSQVTAIHRHVAYLERHHHEGTFLLSGPAEHDGIDEVILAAGPREQIEQVAAEDPLVVTGQATYEIVAVDVTRHDDALVLELQAALGEPTESEHPPWPLTPVPVSLGELAGCLDGDPLQGHGAVDLLTGDIYPPGTLEYDRPEELDEDSDSFDPDRWLFFHPESGDGYRDMLDFAADLPDGPLRQQLFRALDGRGAFRRFRDVLSNDAYEVQLTRWL